MNNLIEVVKNEQDRLTVSARDLHRFLEASERFQSWFDRNVQYGFEENIDYIGRKEFNTLARQELQDYQITIEMGKEISMLQRNEKGKQARKYFIKLETEWNSPERVMARALQFSEQLLNEKTILIEEMKPKALFADAVASSQTSILIGDLAKLIKQNGVNIGQNRLFEWLRANGFLIKRSGSSYNMPTQRSLEMNLFEIKERTINNPDGSVRITKTTKVTGKGQIYFINKFIGINEA